jgi:hypothetical protein
MGTPRTSTIGHRSNINDIGLISWTQAGSFVIIGGLFFSPQDRHTPARESIQDRETDQEYKNGLRQSTAREV